MEINNIAIDEGPSIYYRDSFRAVLEDHLGYLRGHEETTVYTIEPNIAYQWTADLFGFLNSKAVPAYMHWIIMRMNNMTSPTEMGEKVQTLLVPSSKTLSTLAKIQRVKGS